MRWIACFTVYSTTSPISPKQTTTCRGIATSRKRLQPVRKTPSRYSLQAHLELVKICGITCKEDATMVCEAIAQRKPKKPYDAIRFLLGVIFCSRSKRNVGLEMARQIVNVVENFGNAQVVGVFVHQDASSILHICQQTGICIAQLHGEESRKSLSFLPPWIESIPVLSVHSDGTFDSSMLEHLQLGQWILFDSPGGGSGKTFSWNNFRPPKHIRWILAGGLSTTNIHSALRQLNPPGVDISSGVCQSDGIRKSSYLVNTFLDSCCS